MADVPALPQPAIEGPDADGFYAVTFEGPGFNGIYGRVLYRAEGDAVARVRIPTGGPQANPIDGLHGGFLMAFLDQALFVGAVGLGRTLYGNSVTLNLASQFVGAGKVGEPLDCMVEVVGDTRRTLFLRGTMEQGAHVVLSYQATLRKLSSAR